MPIQEREDRREYYRIDDEIALHLRLLAEDAGHAGCAFPEDALLFSQLEALQALELQTQPLLRQLGERDALLANCLRLFEQRNTLLTQTLLRQVDTDFGNSQQVNLSEVGLRMIYPQELLTGRRLALKILLLPQLHALLLCARIIHCQPVEGGYSIGLEFENLSAVQRQVLARHILHLQAQQRRQARAQGGDEPFLPQGL